MYEDVTGITLQRDDEREHKFAFDCVMSQEIGQREVYARTSALPINFGRMDDLYIFFLYKKVRGANFFCILFCRFS